MLHSMDQVRSLFHKHDLRCTRQRELVYSALASTTAHPTAEELYHAVRDIDQGLSLATVYNTLEALVERGLSRRISNGSGPCHYDADMQPHVHVSVADGTVRDVPDDLSAKLLAGVSPELMKELEQRMGVKIATINMQLVAAPSPRCNCDSDYSGEC
jgi:Fur family transcriptional regulator, peroxide stress response regulator